MVDTGPPGVVSPPGGPFNSRPGRFSLGAVHMRPMHDTSLSAAPKPIPGLDFVAIDFETANPKRESVCQIGLVKVRDGQPGRQHCHMVLPPPGFTNFHERNIAVHGITRRDMVGAKGWDIYLAKLIAFTGNLPLVGHNVSFEKSVITRATEAINAPVPLFDYLCTMKLARLHFPNEPSHRLNDVSRVLELPDFQHHHAGADAEASALIVLRLAERTGLTTLQDLWGAKTGVRR